MGFFVQLLLLLWKNFTLRRRQKGRLIVEIFWPLFLFLILVWIRTKDLTNEYEPCVFQPKILPSAGFMPWIQSFACSFANDCQNNASNPDPSLGVLGDDLYNGTSRNFRYRSVFAFLARATEALMRDPISLSEALNKVSLIAKTLADLSVVKNESLLFSIGSAFNNQTVAEQTLVDSYGFSKLGAHSFMESELTSSFFSILVEKILEKGASSLTEIFKIIDDMRPIIFCNQTVLHECVVGPDVNLTGREVCGMTGELSSFLLSMRSNLNLLYLMGLSTPFLHNITGTNMDLSQFQTLRNSIPIVDKFVQDSKFSQLVQDFASDYRKFVKSAVDQNPDTNVNLADFLFCDSLRKGFRTFVGGPLLTRKEKITRRFRPGNNPRDGQNVLNAKTVALRNETGNTKWQNGSIIELCGLKLNHTNELYCGQLFEIIPKYLRDPFTALFRGYILVTSKYGGNHPVLDVVADKLNDWLKDFESTRESILWNIYNSNGMLEQMRDSDIIRGTEMFLHMVDALETSSGIKMDLNWIPVLNETVRMLLEGNGTELFNLTMIEPFLDVYKCFRTDRILIVPNETWVEEQGSCLQQNNLLLSGVVFSNLDPKEPGLPKFVKYKIRMDPYLTDGTRQLVDRVWSGKPRSRYPIDMKYLAYGFSYLQDMVDHIIIELQSKNQEGQTKNFVSYITQQFPQTCWFDDRFIRAIERTLPLFMVFAWIYTASMIVKGIVYEKERRLKEVMKVMGLTNLVHWLAWFIHCFAIMLISVIILVLLIRVGRIAQYSDPTAVFFFMVCFTISTISLSFLISTFFSHANLAACCGGIIYFILYLPYPVLMTFESNLSPTNKIFACLMSNVAFGYGCQYLAAWEQDGRGLQWSNIDKSPHLNDDFSFIIPCCMLLLDSLIHFILTWYIEAVCPGQYGIPRPWYFPFQITYWMGAKRPAIVLVPTEGSPIRHAAGGDKCVIESEPKHYTVGVSVENLKKVYGDGKLAVNNLSLNFYENQITSFLGHNGAGKTTTLSILLGMFPPTEGTVQIYKRDIRTEINMIRKSLGMCPQHNVLFDDLTVEEQLWFYAGLKGVPSSSREKEVNKMLVDLGLPDKADTPAKKLSGGMQRKLSIAVALIGGSRTVILDEPTAGVDPHARRSIWDLLLKHRKGRTIILSTHHMDEADILGDRIAIISQGRLLCCGSSMFLKKNYGSGYQLSLTRLETSPSVSVPKLAHSDSESQLEDGSYQHSSYDSGVCTDKEYGLSRNSSETGFRRPSVSAEKPSSSGGTTTSQNSKDLEGLRLFIQQYIPSANLVSNIGSEIVFTIPLENTSRLGPFFKAFDSKLDIFKIASYGISDTTLEEVFLKVLMNEGDFEESEIIGCHNFNCSCFGFGRFLKRKMGRFGEKRLPEGEVPEQEDDHAHPQDHGDNMIDPEDAGESSRHGGRVQDGLKKSWLLRRQFTALLEKRFHHFKRSVKGAFAEILLPVFFVAIAMVLAEIQPGYELDEPQMPLTPYLYPEPNYIFYSNDTQLNGTGTDLAKACITKLVEPPGLGVRCMKGHPLSSTCSDLASPSGYPYFSTSLGTPAHYGFADGPGLGPDAGCSCREGQMACQSDPYEFGAHPFFWQTNTSDYIVDATGYNITDWIVTTEKSFARHRFGGFSLSRKVPGSEIEQDQEKLNLFLNESYESWLDFARTSLNLTQFLPNNATSPKDMPGLMLLKFMLRANVTTTVKLWYDNRAWAALPIYTNILSNAVLRASLPPGSDATQFGIETINHPVNFTEAQKRQRLNYNIVFELVRVVVIILAFSFVPASFVLFLIDERVKECKHLQFVSGVRRWLYWLATFTWDLANFCIPVLLCFVLFAIFNDRAYLASPRVAMATLILFLLYGFATIPLMYPFSWFFNIPSYAMISLAAGNLFIGVITTLTTTTLENLEDEDKTLADVNRVLMKVFLLFPQYCFGRGQMDLKMRILVYVAARDAFGVKDPMPDPFEWEFLGRNLFCMLCVGIVAFLFVLALEYKLWKCLRFLFCIPCVKSWFQSHAEASEGVNLVEVEDKDVAAERERVLNLTDSPNSVVRCVELAKTYHTGITKRFKAVRGLSFAIPRGQCFGLLGVNGAGKSTTFNMLTGKLTISRGDAFFQGRSITRHRSEAYKSIGFCPQFDAINENLTARELLGFYAKIRGFQDSDMSSVVDASIRRMQLGQYASRPCGLYSGGNKRKLSTAIALIGDPDIVLLDEPTTGMDPRARRFLWNRITDIVRDNRSVILTSHSMEECEALCNRIAIMVNGRFQCIGNIQKLKNRFGEGYTVIVKLCTGSEGLMASTSSAGSRRASTIDRVCAYIKAHFPGTIVKEQHFNMAQFQLPATSNVSVGAIFTCLEDGRSKYGIEDYSVAQTTLDQVFISFAQAQVEKHSKEVAPVRLFRRLFNFCLPKSPSPITTTTHSSPDLPLDDRVLEMPHEHSPEDLKTCPPGTTSTEVHC